MSIMASALLVSSIGTVLGQTPIKEGQVAQASYLATMCSPTRADGLMDLNAPCNAVSDASVSRFRLNMLKIKQIIVIQTECVFGPRYLQWLSDEAGRRKNKSSERTSEHINAENSAKVEETPSVPMRPNDTQRVCICESQFFDQAGGCYACYKAHGSKNTPGQLDDKDLARASRSYCAIDTTPTVNFKDFIFSIVSAAEPSITPPPKGPPTFVDPLRNLTDVSYYFTPRATGSVVWNLTQPDGPIDVATYTFTNVKDGQIVALEKGTKSTSCDGSLPKATPKSYEGHD